MTAALKLDERPFEVVCSSTDRPAWLQARMSGIGASEISAVLGLNRYVSELELFLVKTGQVARDGEDSEAAQWGHELEGKILEGFSRRTGRAVQRASALLRSREHPWALATLDAWQVVPTMARAKPVECKLTGAFGRDWDHGVPEYFMPQVQQQMLVTGEDMASFAVLINGTRLVYADVQRDNAMIAQIVEAGTRFWAAVQGAADAPVPDGSESAGWALKQLYKTPDPKDVAILDWHCAELTDRADAVDAELKSLERERDRIRQTIQQQMGAAEVAILPGEKGGWTWKLQKRAAYTVEVPESEFRVMRRAKPKGQKR